MSTPTTPPPDKEIKTIKILGFDIPLTKMAIQLLSVLAVIAIAWIFYETKIDPYIEKMEKGKMASKQLAEFQRHFSESPTYSTEAVHGKLWLSFFQSDGCVLVRRDQVAIWVPNPDLIPMQMSPGKIGSNLQGVVENAEAGGQCMNPHDGTFNQWTGEVRGCWIQVWRQWYDGCKGYGWYESCGNYWDVQFYWVYCIH